MAKTKEGSCGAMFPPAKGAVNPFAKVATKTSAKAPAKIPKKR